MDETDYGEREAKPITTSFDSEGRPVNYPPPNEDEKPVPDDLGEDEIREMIKDGEYARAAIAERHSSVELEWDGIDDLRHNSRFTDEEKQKIRETAEAIAKNASE